MKNLYKIRTEKHMSQLALSVKLGVAQETISAYERGKAFPGVDTLIKLCDIFNVSADFMLDRTEIRYSIKDFDDKNISADEMELIAAFRKLTYPQKNKALGIIIGMSEQ